MHSMVSKAKLNLGLKVLYKREDGYHNINSIFIKINWGDEISFERTDTGKLELVSKNELKNEQAKLFEEVSERGDPSKNILSKTYNTCKTFHPGFPGLKINLRKRIPPGGGLGGGSSNAAALLKHLFFGTEFEFSDTISNLGLKIGADVPFFLFEGNAKVSGIGEKLNRINLAHGNGVLFIPEISISTKESYSYLKKPLQKYYTGKEWEFLTARCLDALHSGEWAGLQGVLGNDFEAYAFHIHPELKQLKMDLYNWGCSFASMTGTGSCIYGLVQGLEIQTEIMELGAKKYPSHSIVPFSF